MDSDPLKFGLSLLTISGFVFFGLVRWISRSAGPTTCPNCHTEKAFRRTQSQTLTALGTGGPKGGRQQVIEHFACSTCGYTLAKNRLETTSSASSTGTPS